jgi:hypothetical protein
MKDGRWVEDAYVLPEIEVTAPLNRDSEKVKLASKNLARDQYKKGKELGRFRNALGYMNIYDNPDFDPFDPAYKAFGDANNILGKTILEGFLTFGTLGTGAGLGAATKGLRFLPKVARIGKNVAKGALDPKILIATGISNVADANANELNVDNESSGWKTATRFALPLAYGAFRYGKPLKGGISNLFNKIPKAAKTTMKIGGDVGVMTGLSFIPELFDSKPNTQEPQITWKIPNKNVNSVEVLPTINNTHQPDSAEIVSSDTSKVIIPKREISINDI